MSFVKFIVMKSVLKGLNELVVMFCTFLVQLGYGFLRHMSTKFIQHLLQENVTLFNSY